MLASCLHPYRDSRGRFYASLLPFLVRRFPRDQEVEVLRSNLVRGGAAARSGGTQEVVEGWVDPREGLEGLLEGKKVDEGMDEGVEGGKEEVVGEEQEAEEVKSGKKVVSGWGVEMDVDVEASTASAAPNAFAVIASPTQETQEIPARPAPPLKRKSEQFEADESKPTKRVDTGKAQPQVAVMSKAQPAGAKDESDSDSDDEGSIEINMGLDDDEDDEEDE